MAKNKTVNILIVGAALFAMFFGAGNLVLPVSIGVTAGHHWVPGTLGFMITGVLLPVLAMVAAATSENGINGIANRIGRVPGFIFALIAFLSTGMLYAIPRTAAVSYSTSIAPNIGDDGGWLGLLVYSFLFFSIAAAMVMNPAKLLDKIGTWLTPALLILLILLITAAAFNLATPEPLADNLNMDKWGSAPAVTGLLEGYGTLDAIASFVFGIIVITSLKQRGWKPGKQLFKGTAIAGVIAGTLLALVYFGLSMVGTKVANKPFTDGGVSLGLAAKIIFGQSGSIIFAGIFILACLTTAVGLIGASVEFFLTIFTKVPRNIMILIHILISMAIANLGTATLFAIVIPLMLFCYPITISITIVCLIDIFVPGHMYWTYRGAVWTAAIVGIIDAANGFVGLAAELSGGAVPAGWAAFYGWIPLSAYSMGWLLPTLILGIVGFIVDGKQGRLKQPMHYSDEPVGLIFQKGLTSTAKERFEAKQEQAKAEAAAEGDK